MSRVLCNADCGVTVNDANPGIVRTYLLDYYFRVTYNPLLLKFLAPLRWLLVKTPRQGAQTTLHLILSPDLQTVTGKYFTFVYYAYTVSYIIMTSLLIFHNNMLEAFPEEG